MSKKLGLWKWVLRPVGLLVSLSAAAVATGSSQASAQSDPSEQTGTIEELTAFILNASPDQDVLDAFCQLQDLSEEIAYDVAAEYSAGLVSSVDGTPPTVSFDSCDMSGSARLVVI